MVMSFLLSPPCEEQEQVGMNAVEVEETQIYQKWILSEWNIQSLERGQMLVRSMISKK